VRIAAADNLGEELRASAMSKAKQRTMPSMDVRDVFPNPEEVIALLLAGETIDIVENGRIVARVVPDRDKSKDKRKPKSKRNA